MSTLGREFAKARQDYENLAVQECELDQRYRETKNVHEKDRLLRRLGEVRTSMLAAMKRMEVLGQKTPEPSEIELPEMLVVCVQHSRPGKPSQAQVKPFPADPTKLIVICVECVEEGRKLQQRLGVKLESQGAGQK